MNRKDLLFVSMFSTYDKLLNYLLYRLVKREYRLSRRFPQQNLNNLRTEIGEIGDDMNF